MPENQAVLSFFEKGLYKSSLSGYNIPVNTHTGYRHV